MRRYKEKTFQMRGPACIPRRTALIAILMLKGYSGDEIKVMYPMSRQRVYQLGWRAIWSLEPDTWGMRLEEVRKTFKHRLIIRLKGFTDERATDRPE